MRNLLGQQVLARDGHLGALDDLYVDAECWQVRYLVVAPGCDEAAEPLLVSAGCAEAAQAEGPITVELSRAQIEAGAGIWTADAASAWLDEQRVCSGCDLLGFRIDAEDGPAGRLSELLVDEQEWSIDYLVIDSAQAGDVRRVLLPLDWVSALDLVGGCVRVQRTLEELHASPQLET